MNIVDIAESDGIGQDKVIDIISNPSQRNGSR